MGKDIKKSSTEHISPFERIRRMNEAGSEYWSSREFSAVLEYGDYRNFEAVVEKAKSACFNSGRRVEDHFVDVTEMIEIGSASRKSRTEENSQKETGDLGRRDASATGR